MMRATRLAVGFACLTMAAVSYANNPSIHWLNDYQAAREQARATGKILLVNIHAVWCVPCKKLQATTLQDPTLSAEINQHCVALSLDADEHRQTIAQWSIPGYPTQLFIAPDGRVVNTIVGFVPVAKYRSVLQSAIQSAGPATARASSPAQKTPAHRSPAELAQSPMPQNNVAARSTGASAGLAAAHPTSAPGSQSVDPSMGFPPPPKPLAATQHRPSTPAPPIKESPAMAAAAENPPSTNAALTAQPTNPLAPPRSAEPRATVGAPPATAPTQLASSEPPPALQDRTSEPAIDREVKPCDLSVPLALNGFCPVSMIKRAELVRGKDHVCCVYKDRRYQFVSEEEKNRFVESPRKFLPAEEGLCVVSWSEGHRRAGGQVEYPALFGEYLFLFADDSARQKFLKDPERYVDSEGHAHRIPLHSFKGDRQNLR